MPGVNRSSPAPTRGPLHQETSQANRADSTTVPAPRKPSCQASQRRRETDCVHARRWVPASTSFATRGAPQKTPMRPGATRKSGTRRAIPRCRASNWSMAWPQSPRAARQEAIPRSRYSWAKLSPVTTIQIASAASTPAAASTWARCWRQAHQVIWWPPSESRSCGHHGPEWVALRGRGRRGLPEVGEDEVLEPDVADLPRGVQDRALGSHDSGGLPVGVALGDDELVSGERAGIAPRADEDAVGSQQVVDVA